MLSARICFEWREQRCRRGAKCRYAHQENLVEACREYQRLGSCRRGGRCSYGHFTGESHNQASQTRPTTASSSSTQAATNLTVTPIESWRRICRIRGPYSPVQMKTFLEGALHMITTKDIGTAQEVIKELANDKNLEHIRQLLEADLAYDGTTGELSFIVHGIPFLKIITNTEFQNSIVIEKYAGTIYNVVYGFSGSRGIEFFNRILSRSKTLMSNNPDGYPEVFAMITSALRHTIHLNSNAMVQDGIKRIAREALVQANEQHLLQNPEMRHLHQNFKVINEKLELGEQLPSLVPAKPTSASQGRGAVRPSLHPAIQNTVRLPGELSESGPRHNNDYVSIADILILPTAEEIRSDVPEYLPQIGAETAFLDRNQKLLDTQFRLLREDSIGCLRESLRQIIENRGNLDVLRGSKKRKKDGVNRFFTAGVAVLIHQNVRVEEITFTAHQGLKVGITFDQPIPNLSDQARREWWSREHEDLLTYNSLVCILNETNEAVFFTVAERYVTERNIRNWDRDDTEDGSDRALSTLAEDPNRAGIILSFANAVREENIEWLSKLAYARDSSQIDLIEFPKTLLAAFRPILQGLQKRIGNTQAIPFIDWLAPDPSLIFQQSVEDGTQVDVRPPPYALRPNFFFDLKSIFTTPPQDPVPLYPAAASDFDIQILLENTTLDDGQAQSLVKALSREVGLIQGPPGTGKSFVGTKIVKVLLANKTKADLGPVVCVCYTNHALDQFLEHLLDIGIDNIVRLGSRSKSERLDKYLLKNLVTSTENTRVEGKEMWDLKAATRDLADDAAKYCNTLAYVDSEPTLRSHIEENYPSFFSALFTRNVDSEGWEVQYGKQKPFALWRKKAMYGPIGRSVRFILNNNLDPWSLTPTEINAVLRFWKNEVLRNAITGLADVAEQHRIKSEKLSTVRKERDRRLLQAADIIGVTTSSLAAHADMLERVQAKVLFCEEAGEILEAHTITTLIPSIEHMILIGDHEQLRPHVANYDLSVESRKGQAYRLDVSLFERLVQQPYGNLALKFPIASLNTQRRMHPTVADLIRLKTYPSLLDAVPDYPPIPGMKKRLFWMTHGRPDSKGDAIKATASYTNDFEQEMAISLVTHLLHQGIFKEKQIAVLTPYLGQMSKLRRSLGNIMDIVVGSRDQDALDEIEGFLDDDENEKKPEDLRPQEIIRKSSLAAAVRIATIDNFQGEEADVVIISLVRSNKEHQCGFLKTSNRINVLLSRAKWGMYIIGDANTAGSVPMWSNVISHMSINDCLGDAFELQCERHKNITILAASKEDFITYAPEGGCSNMCEWRLQCGHACGSKCHSSALHNLTKCHEPCPKQLAGCGHPCGSNCGQPCAPCLVPIREVPLKCGHRVTEMKCFKYQKLEEYFCRVRVEKVVPGCNHKILVDCGRDVTSSDFRCTSLCRELIACGHSCLGRCIDCRKPSTTEPGTFDTKHVKCKQRCDRPFNTCTHSCARQCHEGEPCGLCERECEIYCQHSKCKGKCKDPCPPCAEQCTLGCEHQRCIMPCGVSCNILPCDQLCSQVLECGHRCPSLCGEKCPDKKFCRVCGPDDVLESVVDMLEFTTYRESTDTPMIFLPCGHFYTVDTFDGVVHMTDFFEFNSPDGWKITKRYVQESSTPEIPRCPDCRAAYTTSARYNEVVKKAQLQISIRQFTLTSNDRLISLIRDINLLQDTFESSRDAFQAVHRKALSERYRALSILQGRLRAYNKQVLTEEQPYHRVYELATYACRRYDLSPETYNPSVVQYRFGIEGAYQELRLMFLQICDMDIIASKDSTPEQLQKIMWKKIATDANTAITQGKKLVEICKHRKQQLIEIQTRIVVARFMALALKHRDEIKGGGDALAGRDGSELRSEAVEDLEECLDICAIIPSCQRLEGDVQETIRAVQGGTFYSVVTGSEMKQVYEAMANEFRGTGHWYVCSNGHQFTVGECGMPVSLGVCNECGARIGGQNHSPAAGVRADMNLERRMMDMTL